MPKQVEYWNEMETLDLIKLWDKYNDQFQMMSHRRTLYEQMARELQQLGHKERSYVQIQKKVANLKELYKKYKASGAGSSSWVYFDAIHKVLRLDPFYNHDLVSLDQDNQADDVPDAVAGSKLDCEPGGGAEDEPGEVVNSDGEDSGSRLSGSSHRTGSTSTDMLEPRRKRVKRSRGQVALDERLVTLQEEMTKILRSLVEQQSKLIEQQLQMNSVSLDLMSAIAESLRRTLDGQGGSGVKEGFDPESLFTSRRRRR